MCLVLVKRPLTQALRSDEIDEGLVFESGLRNRRWRSNILKTAHRWRDGLRPRSSMSIDFSTLGIDEEFYIILSFKGHTYYLTKWNARKGFIFWHSFSCLCILFVLVQPFHTETTFWVVKILQQPVRRFYLVLSEANSQNKMNHKRAWKTEA